MIGFVYYPDTGVLPGTLDTSIKVACSAGTVVGQVGFGILNDVLGRKKVIPTKRSDGRCTDWS